MDCLHVKLPGGASAIVCGAGLRAPRRRCRFCGAPAPLLCDWKLEAIGTVHTCDHPICAKCAFEAGPDKHLCPAHVLSYRRWLVETQLIPLT